MESKAIIDAYCRIRTIDNTIPDEVLDYMKEASLSHATIVREHQLMKEALEEMRQAFFEPGTVNEFWLRKHINDTLKQITL